MRLKAGVVSIRVGPAVVIAVSVLIGLTSPGLAQEQTVLTGRGIVMPGVYSAEWESFDDLTALADATGKRVTFSGTFHNAAREPGWTTDRILEQSWQAQTTPLANVTIPDTAASVAMGVYDPELRRWARQVKAWLDRGEGRSLFIAPFQEMNGTWTPYGGDPTNFKIAYRKVIDAFDEIGVDETRVRFVFAPNSFSDRPYRIADYYPGGTLVDVVGMSAYNLGPSLGQWTWVPQTMDSGLAELRAIAPRKPIIITQVGSSPIEGNQVAWIREMFQYVTADPQIVGIVYFNFNKETDWRIWTGKTLSDGWRQGMDQDTTVHVWPMTDWFQPGPIPFSVDGGPYLGSFVDVEESPFLPDIQWVADQRISVGCDAPVGDRYCAGDPVTRAQMASFLARALKLSPASPTAGDLFVDIGTSGHRDDINRIARAGISIGCGGSRFCGYDLVDRGQMASFLARALGLPPTHVDYFIDDDRSPHEEAINAIASHGLVHGCAASLYCPDQALTRGEMAAFLRRFLRG